MYDAASPEDLDRVGAVGHQAPARNEITPGIDCGQPVLGRQLNDHLAMSLASGLGITIRPPFGSPANVCNGSFDLRCVAGVSRDQLDANR